MVDEAGLVLQALAERLELPYALSGLRGTWRGVPTTVRVSTVATHVGQTYVLDGQGSLQQVQHPRQLSVEVSMPIVPRLDVGLHLGPVGPFLGLAAAGRSGHEQRLTLRGTDPARVAGLVTPETLALLDRSFVGDPGPGLTDGGLTWGWRGPPPWPTVDQLLAAFEPLPAAWAALCAASRVLPPPPTLAAPFAVLAGLDLPPGLDLLGCPCGVVGAIEDTRVSVTVAPHVSAPWLVRCAVLLHEPLVGNPKVLREDRFGWMDRLGAFMAGRSEIEVGDAAFDRRFAVRSLKPDQLKELLDPEVRRAMLALDARLPVELSAVGFAAHGPQRSDDELRAVVDATLALGRAVAAVS